MVYINIGFFLVHLVIFGGKPESVPFRTASGKIPKAWAGLALEQQFF